MTEFEDERRSCCVQRETLIAGLVVFVAQVLAGSAASGQESFAASSCHLTEVERFFDENADRDILRRTADLKEFLSGFVACNVSFTHQRVFTYVNGEPVYEPNEVEIATTLIDGRLNGCMSWQVPGVLPSLSGEVCFDE